jgi:hypothetical protein
MEEDELANYDYGIEPPAVVEEEEVSVGLKILCTWPLTPPMDLDQVELITTVVLREGL